MQPTLRAAVEKYLIDPSLGWSGSAEAWQPLAFVDLDACEDIAQWDSLPPFPVIGFGERRHRLASTLDAVLESPIDAETLIKQVERAPRAAAVTVQLLRTSERLSLEHALAMESLAYGLLQGSEEYAAWLMGRRPSPDPEGRVIVERQDATLHIVLDRPHARNAINRVIRDQLCEAFTLASLDPEIRSVKLRSVGEAFSAGGDLEEFGTTTDPATAHLIRARTLPALALARRREILDVHIQGAAIGAGVEISAFAGRVTAAPTAWFQLPELAMGLLPGAGGCVSVPRRIGRQRAALMMLSGQRIDAQTALRWRLIDAIEDQPPVTV
ncbi:enoyl-CoA hydratase [Steroidobacter agaridevorans]|uniref:Enoyl-CoA hydratase n=1 Tax=Steroidobacter agaridevorans TaxID=2695856 RepID=A0A829Y9Z8_9GAMM|nr:enoyl-CoA hydratase/isomerase family protein [Steroidobacter agaridevorans]GFE79813.1 enoyl-CoA hydratase [Steroidobacter agaridevorans]GFE90643.1 enoyl-CoA hydratase [Steroidobacter agaridevorans]